MILKNLDSIVKRFIAEREGEIEIDPITLSRGLVLDRIGPSKDKWGRDINLVLVKVLKKNEHHKKDDEVIWEIPTEDELKKVATHGVHTRTDLLRLWVNSPGSDAVSSADLGEFDDGRV